MRALILAAGRGVRLQPLTDDRPKCLVVLAGRSLLAWQCSALRAAGISEIAVVVGWRAGRVRCAGLVRFVNRAWRWTNMVASMLTARAWLAAGPCIVAYGDVVYHAEVVRRLAISADDIAITYDPDWLALWRARFQQPEHDAESLCVVDGRVRAIGGRVDDIDAVDGQFMGLLRVTPVGLAQIDAHLARSPAGESASLETTHLLAAMIAEGVRVGAVAVGGSWCEVDRIEDLTLYERRLRDDPTWRHDWRKVPS